MNEHIILADVDGCMLWWKRAFDAWMHKHGYKRVHEEEVYDIGESYGLNSKKADTLAVLFNESVYMGHLPPLRDAIKYVRKLHENHGYVFHCITAVGTHPLVHEQRKANLHRVFGPSVVERLVCTERSKDKKPILAEYQDSGLYWIEDKVTNAQMGAELGLKAILMNHAYNATHTGDFIRVNSWREIYDIIT